MRILSSPAALTSALWLAAPAALAAQTTGSAMGWHEGPEPKFKLTVAEAISGAEKHSGKLLDISFASSNGRPTYRVRTFQNIDMWDGTVDANSGQVRPQQAV